jgi:hypothetical protein
VLGTLLRLTLERERALAGGGTFAEDDEELLSLLERVVEDARSCVEDGVEVAEAHFALSPTYVERSRAERVCERLREVAALDSSLKASVSLSVNGRSVVVRLSW